MVDARARTGSGLGRKLLLQVLLVPLALVAAELLFRGWARLEGEPYDAGDMRQEVERIEARVGRQLSAWSIGKGVDQYIERLSSPYLGWEFEPNLDRMRTLDRYAERDVSQRVYDIVLVGGSVAAAFEADASSYLRTLLAKDARFADRPIRVHGFATGAFKQPQQLYVVACILALGVRPDAVINLDGFNELAIGAQNAELGAHPLHPSITQWAHLPLFGLADRAMLDALVDVQDERRRSSALADLARSAWLPHSAVLGRLVLDRARASQRRYVAANRAYSEAIARRGAELGFLGPDFDRAPASVLELDVRNWIEASRSLKALCDARSIHYVHVLQPTLHDAGSKPLTPREIETGASIPSWTESIAAGYPRLRAGGARLAAEGVHFIDGSQVFRDVRETLYIDACHFTGRGARILADRVAEAFLASLD